MTLRQLQKRVSGNAQDYEEVIKRAKRQSSSTGALPSSQPSSKRVSAHNSGSVLPSPGMPVLLGDTSITVCMAGWHTAG